MLHTKQEIENIVKKVMGDIERQYHKDEDIHIEFKENLEIIFTNEILKKGWLAGIPVDDDQFHHPDGSVVAIYINDETGEIAGYQDSSMGRPVPLLVKKDEMGKYYLTVRDQ